MNARTAATLGLLSAGVLGAALGHCRGVRTGMCIGYAYGDRDGVRRERRRLESQAMLDAVLATPPHTAPSFWAAVRHGALRDRAAEEVTP